MGQLLEGAEGDGSDNENKIKKHPRLLLRMGGARHIARLEERPGEPGGAKELCWSDGEIWRRIENPSSVAPVGGPAATRQSPRAGQKSGIPIMALPPPPYLATDKTEQNAEEPQDRC